MQFVQEHPYLDRDLQDKIVAYLKADSTPFEPSLIYQVDIQEKKLNPDRRQSVFKTIVKSDLFDLCDQLLVHLNKLQNEKIFILVRNDVTYIKYSAGGYFKAHEDYLSLTSNFIEEFTLLMCVDANCTGGETILHFNQFFKYPSRSSITPGSVLLFRKDILHEGAILESGYKEIMMLNLWAIPKESKAVSIIFDPLPDTSQTNPHDANQDTGKSQPIKINRKSPNYVLSENTILNFPDNMLSAFVRFSRQQGNTSPLLIYRETQWSYDQFKIVADIYNRKAISYKEISSAKDILEYHGFDFNSLLIKSFADDPSMSKPVCHTQSLSDDLILHGDVNAYREMLHIIKDNLLHYVPFKMILAEGSMTFGGGASENPPVILKMEPIWLSVSDKDNVVAFSNLIGLGFKSIVCNGGDLFPPLQTILPEGMAEKFQAIPAGSKVDFFPMDAYNEEEDAQENPSVIACNIDGYTLRGNAFHLNLDCFFEGNLDDIINLIMKMDPDLKFTKNGNFLVQSETKYYDIDITGDLCLNNDHIIAMRKKLAELDIYQQVKRRIQTINFTVAQSHHRSESNEFCNESVYTNANLIIVYGFIKMD